MTFTTMILGLAALQTAALAPAPTPRPPAAAARVAATPREGWLPQDPADSLYRGARTELNAGNYRRASQLFAQIRERFPRSGYVAASMYWQAFALQRIGGREPLREARTLLRQQLDRYPDDATTRDARNLMATVQADLARAGDPEAAQAVAQSAATVAPPAPPTPPAAARPAPAPRPPVGRGTGRGRGNDGCDDESEAMIALQALMNMRSEQALPILRRLMARRDAEAVCLRRHAMFILAQQRSPEVTGLLLEAARSDPDPEVREQAVFWLSQVNAPEAVAALDSILQRSTDRDLQDKAIFALSQQRAPAAAAALRRFLERTDTPVELRGQVVFWLGQRHDEESAAYLREFFTRTSDAELKEQILFAVSQHRSEANGAWLVAVALDEAQPIEVRKNAIFWAGQQRSFPIGELQRLYGQVQNREVREQIIFALSQRRDDAAVDALIAVARQEQDRELRRSAIFWLGQSNNPRAAEFLMELLDR